MKASELVSDLIEMISKNGDVEVFVEDSDQDRVTCDVSVEGGTEYEDFEKGEKRSCIVLRARCFYC